MDRTPGPAGLPPSSSDASDGLPLQGRHVSLAGKLATLSRAQALSLIAECGGVYAPAVTRQTSLVIVGLAGWPLRRDGRVSRKLQRAAALQEAGHPLEVLREEEWLERLGLRDRHDVICRRYTLDQIVRLVRVSPDRVRRWMRVGLVEPVETRHGIPCFDFRQVAALKRLDALTRAGVTASRLRRSLNQLAVWLPEAEESLTRLDLLDRRRLVVRSADGSLADPTGQRLFDFAEPAPSSSAVRSDEPSIRLCDRGCGPTADELFARAAALEQEGAWKESEAAYRAWLAEFGPDAAVCFNLANVLYRRGDLRAAIERFQQSVEIDPDFVDAWTNLGCVLSEAGRHSAALDASQRALRLDPMNGNALYNLADTLDELGRTSEAFHYWSRYLDQDRDSPWAEHARRRIARRG